MATGMLPICLDEATKVIAEIESGAKGYEFTVPLGARTDTGDAEGRGGRGAARAGAGCAPSKRRSAGFAASSSRCRRCIRRSSATDGRSMSWRGRAWKWSAPRAPSRSAAWNCWPRGPDALDLVCECAKGTYIRVLGEDIARALGTCGHLTRLRRPWVEPFRDMAMVTLEAVAGAGAGRTRAAPAAGRGAAGICRGRGVVRSRWWPVAPWAAGPCDWRSAGEAGAACASTGPEREFLGLAEALPDGRLQPRRLIAAIAS